MLGRLGRWCFRRRWWVLAIWLLAMVAGVLSAGPVFHGLTGGGGPKSLESVAANQVLADAADRGGTVVAVIDQVEPAARGVDTVTTPYDTGVPKAKTATLIAADARAVLVQIQLGKLDKLARHDAVVAISDRLHKLGDELVGAGQSGTRVRVGGSAALGKQANDAVQGDLALAEEVSLPLTLVILIFVFGGLVAAGPDALRGSLRATIGEVLEDTGLPRLALPEPQDWAGWTAEERV